MGTEIPFHRVRVHLDEPSVGDVTAHVDGRLAACGVALPAGGEVAIAVGSRGISDQRVVVERVAAWVRAQGCTPFLVPAMGSHGGAAADGQAELLESYGLGPSMGLEIRSSMDVIELPQGRCPIPVATDTHAWKADAVIVVNRVKPHTDFHAAYESGLVKMIAIGLGKRVQAERIHAHGAKGLRELVAPTAEVVLKHTRVMMGVAIVENAHDQTMAVEVLPAARILAGEPPLLELARAHMPALPVDQLDVLLVDRMGKDVSGVGMDTNVIGRMMITGEPEPARPRIGMIACHRLTEGSHGNATGMGLADVVPRAFAEAIDHGVTRTNIMISGFLLRGKLPVVADDDRHAWQLCLRGVGARDPSKLRAARIVDTLHCSDLWVTDAVLAELTSDRRVEVVARDLALHDGNGDLAPFAAG
ncbi:MAG TPA: DUF362 domain-containing protein [Acidimicrobiales bacterium]